MKILGIDSSGLVASVALIDEENVISEFTVNNKQTHSQTLLPMIDTAVKMAQIELEEIAAIAIAAGPGSFTGLRIGSSTAKGLAQALDKPIVSVPTLEGLAFRFAGTDGIICPLMDARRNQVYTAAYHVNENGIETVIEQDAVDIHDILSQLNNYSEKVTFLGDGVAVHKEVIQQEMQQPYQFAVIHLNKQSAAAVAALGMIYYKDGKIEKAEEHKPEYLRKSQAERERESRMNA